MKDLIAEIDGATLASELSGQRKLAHSRRGGLNILLVDGEACPQTLREIGRLRELTFRDGGSGTGEALDLDDDDRGPEAYWQMLLYQPEQRVIVGGTRVKICPGLVDPVRRNSQGRPRIATADLYDMSDRFVADYLPHLVDIGRMFVQPQFQIASGSRLGLFALEALFDGLAAIAEQTPELHYFFGRIVTPPTLHPRLRDLIMLYMQRHFAGDPELLQPKSPLDLHGDHADLQRTLDGDSAQTDMRALLREAKRLGQSVPGLLRAYLSLSNTLKSFGGAADHGLGGIEETAILLTYADVHPRKRARFRSQNSGGAPNPDTDRARGMDAALRQSVKITLAHLHTARGVDAPAAQPLPAAQLAQRVDLTLPEEGRGPEALAKLTETYLQHSVRTASPRFGNQLFGGQSLPGVAGELVAAASNTSMYTYEVAPLATLIERQVVTTLGQKFGFGQADGLMLPGGSAANQMAMLLARHRLDPQISQRGLFAQRPLVAFVSAQAHYSFAKGAVALGLGSQHLVKVACDARGRMQPEALAAAVRKARNEKKQPFFVACTAGTTVRGAFDPIEPVAAICAREKLWLHVDGAWGGPVIFSNAHRHLLDGTARADSITFDAHKLMGLPLTCTVLLVKQSGLLQAATAVDDTAYLLHENNEASLDLGQKSLQCGRRVDAVKLWLDWQVRGDQGYARHVDHMFELTKRAERFVHDHPRLELACPRESLNLCFRYLPVGLSEPGEIDRFNLALRERLLRSGRFMLNHAPVDDRPALRMVFAHQQWEPGTVDMLLGEVLSVAAEKEKCLRS